MAAYDWAKLWIDMLDDRKAATLPDSSWRRFVECILLAKELNEGGYLPSVPDMAWRLRIDAGALDDDLTRLALAGLLERREDDRWFVTNFEKRQRAATSTERSTYHRNAKRKALYRDADRPETTETQGRNESATKRCTDKDKDKEEEGEKIARARLAPQSAAVVSPLPPASLRYEPADRTPDGFRARDGYRPPPEPEPPPKPEPSPDIQAVGAMANAITDVTGISAKLPATKIPVYECAVALVDAGYTPEQVRAHYGADKVAGVWHWYEADWRGKRGDKPRLKEIQETIAGAVEARVAGPKKKPSQIDLVLAMFGNAGPEPAMS